MPQDYDKEQQQGQRSINSDQQAQQDQDSQQTNQTGIPDNIKTSIEYMSGFSLDHVRVFYNSDKPAKMDAFAYTDGDNVYVAPGQEDALSHELWHIVQQMDKKVKKTGEIKRKVPGNDDKKLEKDADREGAKAKGMAKGGDVVQREDLKEGRGQGVVQRLEQPMSESIMDPDGSGFASDDAQIEALLKDAQRALGPFTKIFNALKDMTKASTEEIEQQKKIKDEDGNVEQYRDGNKKMQTVMRSPSSMGGLKGEERIKQKMQTKYKNKKDRAVLNINDVVRGTLAFNTFKEMYEALKIIRANAGKKLGGESKFNDDGEIYKIVRIKQIYSPLSALLYGDVKLNLEVDNHNCELQLNTVAMLKGKGTKAGHGAYEAWRDLDDAHWKEFGTEMPSNVRDIKDDDFRARAANAVKDSFAAYNNGVKQENGLIDGDAHFYKVLELCEEMGAQPPETDKKKADHERIKAAAKKRYDEFIAKNKQ